MANHNAARKTGPLEDVTRKDRVYEEYDIPEELYPVSSTTSFGNLRVIGLKQLTPLEEKHAVGRAKGDSLRLAYELAQSSIGFVRSVEMPDKDQVVAFHNGSLDLLIAEMNPQIRNLVMQAYSELAAPPESASTAFLKSRKTRA